MLDIWEYKDPQYPTYPTEKNPDLLDLIIKTSSNKESIVLDCFCGSGTTLKSAQTNNRKWIGIDQSEHAIKATKEKLETVEGDLFIAKPDYEYIELTDTMPSCQQRLIASRQEVLNSSEVHHINIVTK